MPPLDYLQRDCPYCGEPCLLVIDCSAGDQHYIEDCQVCCRPMQVSITLAADGTPRAVELRSEDD